VAGAAEILRRFRALYPASDSPRIWRAPGRVNLIGEHTDYNHGLVLPMAIDLFCFVATAPSRDGWLRVYSDQLARGSQWRMEDIPSAVPRGDWSDRVLGTAWALVRRGIPITGQNILLSSTVPMGGGLSSSAALGVAMALALGGPRPPLELAQLAQAAEVEFVGLPCGIMDQFISANGQAGAAILLDCRSLTWSTVRLPEDVAIVTANSMVRHDLGESAYRTRVAECAEAARELAVSSLRDAIPPRLNFLTGVLLKRARHVVTENARVKTFAAAAARGDLQQMGQMVTASHVSLRDDYEVSCPELDFLVETALGVPGVLGARMTGAGFGGSTVNLVQRASANALKEALVSGYEEVWDRTPEIHVCTASSGATAVLL
jgi:galactokinase